jgi:hypothetical protein
MADHYQRTQKLPAPTQVKDITSIVRYLVKTFNLACSSLERAARTEKGGANRAYLLQTEFAYKLNEVMMCHPSILQKNIADCNEFIDEVVQLISQAD